MIAMVSYLKWIPLIIGTDGRFFDVLLLVGGCVLLFIHLHFG